MNTTKRIGGVHLLAPGLNRSIEEARVMRPKILETKACFPRQQAEAGKKKRTVIRARDGKGVNGIGGEERVPSGVTEESIKLDEGGVLLLVSPGEVSVDASQFEKLSLINVRAELAHEATTKVEVALVSCFVD